MDTTIPVGSMAAPPSAHCRVAGPGQGQPASGAGEPPVLAADLAQISGQSPAEETAHRSTSTLVKVGLGAAAAVTVLTLAGCGPAPPIGDTLTSSLPTAGVSVDPQHTGDFGVEVLAPGTARIDLHRETRTERDSDGDTHEEDVPYSPVGVYLGDGVFLDTNGNLSLLPERVFQESDRGPAASSAHIDGPGPFSDWNIHSQGNRVTVDSPGPGGYQFTHEGNRIDMDGPLWSNLHFTRDGSRTRVDFPLLGNFTVERLGEGRARVSGPLLFGYDITRQGDTVRVDGPLGNDYTVTREGSTLKVDGPLWGDLTISQHGTTTHQKAPGVSYNVTRDGNSIRTDGPGMDDWNLSFQR